MKQSSTGLISGQPASRRHDKSERARSRRKPVLGETSSAKQRYLFTRTAVNSRLAELAAGVLACDTRCYCSSRRRRTVAFPSDVVIYSGARTIPLGGVASAGQRDAKFPFGFRLCGRVFL